MSSNYNLNIKQGDVRVIPVTIALDGVALDISGLSGAEIKYRAGKRGNEDLIEYIEGDGIEFTTDGTDGKVKVTLASDDTELEVGSYEHELRIDATISGDLIDQAAFSGTLRIDDSLMVAD